MSAETVELQRRTIDAFNARDVEGFIALSDPGIELHSAFATVGGAVYHGPDGVRSWLRDFENAWAEAAATVGAYFDLGEDLLTFFELHGRGRTSGVEVTMDNALVAKWRDGLLTYLKIYAHREDALSDLGVSDAELEPIAPY